MEAEAKKIPGLIFLPKFMRKLPWHVIGGLLHFPAWLGICVGAMLVFPKIEEGLRGFPPEPPLLTRLFIDFAGWMLAHPVLIVFVILLPLGLDILISRFLPGRLWSWIWFVIVSILEGLVVLLFIVAVLTSWHGLVDM